MSQRLKLADHGVGVLDSVSNASLMEVWFILVLVLCASWRTAKCALICTSLFETLSLSPSFVPLFFCIMTMITDSFYTEWRIRMLKYGGLLFVM